MIATEGAGVEWVNELPITYVSPRDVLVALNLDFNDRMQAASVEKTVTGISATSSGRTQK